MNDELTLEELDDVIGGVQAPATIGFTLDGKGAQPPATRLQVMLRRLGFAGSHPLPDWP